MIALAYDGSVPRNNPRELLFKGTLTGNYGVQGTGDLLNLTPSQNNGVDGGITDPAAAYDEPLAFPPAAGHVSVFQDNLAGYYAQIAPNANPTLKNFGVRIFASEGNELTTNEAYPAGVLNAVIEIRVLIPLQ